MVKQDAPIPLIEERLNLFLKPRKGARDQCLEIISIILQKENEYPEGRVPFVEIKKHMDMKFTKKNSWNNLSDAELERLQKKGMKSIPKIPRGHLSRLLDDMERFHIVKKWSNTDPTLKSPNKNRVYYQCCGEAITPVFNPKGTSRDYPRLYDENIVLKNSLEYALCLLNEVPELIEKYEVEMERRKALKEQWKHLGRDEVNRKIRNMTPEEFQEYKKRLEHDRKFYLSRDVEKMRTEKV
jgi:hypothetical protein